MKKTLISLLAAGALAAVAQAQLVYNIQGGTGVKAQFTFTFDDTANTVTVSILNTIPGVGGATGRITSFGFNTPFTAGELGAGGANVSFIEDVPGDPWTKFVPFDLSPNPPLGQDFGVGANNTEEGGGGGGIVWNSSAIFVFTFPDFTGEEGWGGENSLSVRFQSVTDTQNGQTSDKVLGTPDDGGGGGSGAVPEPSTYGLFGALALLGIMIVRQVRRR